MSFKRKMKREQLNQMPLAKFNPFERPSLFEVGGHLIKKKAKEMSENAVGQVSMDAYTEGVQNGVEKATKFAIKCLENALADTKGIGDKRKEEINNNFRNHFNNTESFVTYLRQKNVPAIKTLHVVDEQTEQDMNLLQSIRHKLTTIDLTVDSLLSIIESNPTLLDDLKQRIVNREEEVNANS